MQDERQRSIRPTQQYMHTDLRRDDFAQLEEVARLAAAQRQRQLLLHAKSEGKKKKKNEMKILVGEHTHRQKTTHSSVKTRERVCNLHLHERLAALGADDDLLPGLCVIQREAHPHLVRVMHE
jgi:hypothetical protein